tara:strand:+ start:227 stop:481 length:255 start_codon:yes stop_codon:yes gene_type:complete
MHLVADLTTGEELDLDLHGISCTHSGYLAAISDLVEPLLTELKSCQTVIDSYYFSHHVESIDNTIADIESMIEVKKAEIRSGIL